MVSFLITKKMDPALARRITQSFLGDAATRRRSPGRQSGRALLRLAFATSVVVLGWFLVSTYRESRREFAIAQRKLLADYDAARRDYERAADRKVEHLAATFAKLAQEERPREFVAERLRGRDGTGRPRIESVLSGPVLYLRASLADLRAPQALREAARDSTIDALAVCLLIPPSELSEASILRHLGKVGPKRLDEAGHELHRFEELLLGREFIASSFFTELSQSEHMSQVERLRKRLERERLSRKSHAARARLLLYAVDEPLHAGAHSDFDGEGKHFVRLGILEPSGDHLLQLRREVSPEWISEKSRLSFSRPLDSCKLGADIRAELAADSAANP